jgi:hypothetical protein
VFNDWVVVSTADGWRRADRVTGLKILPNLMKFVEIWWDRTGPRLEIGDF